MTPACIIINIDVPQDDICFVITPYRRELAILDQAIADIARKNDLTPEFNRDISTRSQKDWAADIRRGIRHSKIVVAVGYSDALDSLDKHTVIPRVSENVMYELGLAHALAKPTLVIWDSNLALPADIRNFRDTFLFDISHFTIVKDDIHMQLEYFSAALSTRISDILKRVNGHVIDDIWSDVSSVIGPTSIFHNLNFVAAFRKLVSFGANTAYTMNLIAVSTLNHMGDQARSIPEKVDKEHFESIVKTSKTYADIADTALVHTFSVLEGEQRQGDQRDSLSTALDNMSSYIIQERAKKLRASYENVLTPLCTFRDIHRQFVRYIDTLYAITSVGAPIPLDFRGVYEVWINLVSKLNQASSNVLANSNYLRMELSELYTYNGGGNGGSIGI